MQSVTLRVLLVVGFGVVRALPLEPAEAEAIVEPIEDSWASLDDACDVDDGTGCALNQLQLRGIKVEASGRDGVSNASQTTSSNACSRVTTGTCTRLSCHAWRGNTSCIDGHCICNEGYCANNYGICVKQGPPVCELFTQKTCRFRDCDEEELGPTTCGENKRCKCKPGTCVRSFSGVCAKPEECLADTGGSCRLFGCHENRGNTECVDGRCVCPKGYCAVDNGAGYGVCTLQPHPDFLAYVAPVNQDHPKFPQPHSKVGTALAFSGGGGRAMTFAMGAYRALEDLGLLKYVDGISSISGGTWASAVYMFSNMSKDDLLGSATSPSQLGLERLKAEPAAMGAAITQSCHPFVAHMLTSHLSPERIWQDFVADIVLKPFGLESRAAFMAGSPGQLERIRRENPQLAEHQFLVPVPNRPPVFVMGGAVLAPVGYRTGVHEAVALQMSPDFTGSPFWPKGRPGSSNASSISYTPARNGAASPLAGVHVGGGLVETFAFGGPAPEGEGQSGGAREHLEPPVKPFTLADAVGISSVAPAAKLSAFGKYQFVVPQVDYWPVLPKSQHQQAIEYQMGDGGNVENSGLMALLQRGATKVAMWVSTYIPLSSKIDFCAPLPAALDLDKVFAGDGPDEGGFAVAPMVSDKFGYDYQDPGNFYSHNQVFAKEELPGLLCELQKLKKAGKPTVHKATYMVNSNPWWGIKGGYKVTLLVTYLEQCTDFEEALPNETQKALGPKDAGERTWDTSGEFARFPRYLTQQQTEEATEVIRLTPSEVNLLAAQSEYFVRENEDLFREVLCPTGVMGLCCRNPKAVYCSR
mmetsp:Transcript_96556/g.278722  ORF Transcript_96556/g.278722 Transcript_96556/m.278722 type:complete len:811 (+) Transcript_96556:62-2494(+)